LLQLRLLLVLRRFLPKVRQEFLDVVGDLDDIDIG
jgi:hypothetical protein